MIKFLLADDHFVARAGVRMLIKEEFQDVEIDECRDWDSAWESIKTNWYDLAILEINMPGAEAIGLLRNIFSLHPHLKVLILTMSSEEVYARAYLQLGVKDFVNKSADAPALRRAILAALNDEKKLNTASLRPFDTLSSRELAVMTYLVKGNNVTQIADMLSLATSTVGTHKAKIMKKLGVTNVIEMQQMFNNV
jgi:DNA-binding NarL/FixJ family response regulator